jgi:hypothetical protein
MKNINGVELRGVDSCQNCKHCLFQTVYDDEDPIQCNLNDQYVKWFETAAKRPKQFGIGDRYNLTHDARREGDELFRVGSTCICDLWEKDKGL